MPKIKYVGLNTVLAKFQRDLRGEDLNEGDVIEWVGEALGFMKIPELQSEKVSFLKVEDYEACLPSDFQVIIQVARDNYLDTIPNPCVVKEETVPDQDPVAPIPVPIDCDGSPTEDYEVAYYRPFLQNHWDYDSFVSNKVYQRHFSPVRLSNNSFFNSIVCKERDADGIYQNCVDEYTIVGTTNRKLRFSFQEGYVAVAYLAEALDEETGYPLIPDDSSCIAAITYYVKWKIAEYYVWKGRAGAVSLAEHQEKHWLKYVRQALNGLQMPSTIDDLQDSLDQSNYLLPNQYKYHNYFRSLTKPEDRRYLR